MVHVVGGGVVLRPDEARTIDLGGFGVTVLADEARPPAGSRSSRRARPRPGWGRRSTSIATAPSRST